MTTDANPFSDLIPAATAARPRVADYHGDFGGYRSALADYQSHLHPGTPGGGGPTPAPAAPSSANAAFDAFRNSTNYQFQLGQGLKAINQGYAARGTLESGAAQKALNDYAQNTAASALGAYMDRLAQQQNMGSNAASNLANAGQNMVQQVTNNNNSGAQTSAQGALINGQAQGNMYGGIAQGVGQIAGALGSSYGTPTGYQTTNGTANYFASHPYFGGSNV